MIMEENGGTMREGVHSDLSALLVFSLQDHPIYCSSGDSGERSFSRSLSLSSSQLNFSVLLILFLAMARPLQK